MLCLVFICVCNGYILRL
uniref:Uncharacterized protein n=1 Tax=Anguilla anguilla TaxID=7936 RepID=A0A0E9QJG9_ANGAN